MSNGFDEVVIVEGGQLDSLLSVLADVAVRPGLVQRLRFAIVEGTIRIKMNDGTWSPPYGEIEQKPEARWPYPWGPSVHRDNIERR